MEWDIMYLYLALDCAPPILEAYFKAVYSRKERQTWWSLAYLSIPWGRLGPTCVYLRNNQIHRTGGPAVIFENGIYIWYFKGKIHREDGPAIERSKTLEQLRNDKQLWPMNPPQFWSIGFYINGVPHRDHPRAAVIVGFLGKVHVEFWNNGRKIGMLYVSEYSQLEPYL